MRRLAEGLYLLVITAWVGSLWAIGYVAAPVLFASLDDRQLAGNLAGRLFAAGGWVSLVAAAYLLTYLVIRWREGVVQRSVFWVVLLAAIIAASSQFGIQPLMASLKAEAWPRDVMESALRDKFAVWHGVSSILYLIESMLGAWMVVQARQDLE